MLPHGPVDRETTPAFHEGLGGVILLHFLDHEVIDLFGLENGLTKLQLLNAFDGLTRIGLLLATDYAIVPVSSFFENPLAYKVLRRFSCFTESGSLKFAGGAFQLEEFVDRKREQYGCQRDRYPLYFSGSSKSNSTMVSRAWKFKTNSSTEAITEKWQRQIHEPAGGFWRDIFRPHSKALPSHLAIPLANIPERLGKDAFIADFVVARLPELSVRPDDKARLNRFITREYINSYVQDFGATLLKDFDLFDSSPIIPANCSTISVRRVRRMWGELGLVETLLKCKADILLEIKHKYEWTLFSQDVLSRCCAAKGSIWGLKEHERIRSIKTSINGRNPTEGVANSVREYLNSMQLPSHDRGNRSSDSDLDVIAQPRSIKMATINFNAPVTIQGDVVTIDGDQYNIASQEGMKNIVTQLVRKGLAGNDIVSQVGELSAVLPPQVSEEDIAQLTRQAIEAQAVPCNTSRLKDMMDKIVTGASGSLLATGIVQGIKLMLS